MTDANEDWFSAELYPSNRKTDRNNQSPRDLSPTMLRYWLGPLGPQGVGLRAGDRVGTPQGVIYELLDDPRPMSDLRRPPAVEAVVLPVDTLYPLVAPLQDQGGGAIQPTIQFSAYAANEEHQDHGTYEAFLGETDLKYLSSFKTNHKLVNNWTYRISAVTVDNRGFIMLGLRRASAAG